MIKRLAHSWFPLVVVAFSLSTLSAGFVYDLAFAGIPYQPDAPIELQLQYDRNRAYADRIYRVGAYSLGAGLAMTILQLPLRLIANRRGAPPSDLS